MFPKEPFLARETQRIRSDTLAYGVHEGHGQRGLQSEGANICFPDQFVAYFEPRHRRAGCTIGGKTDSIS